MRSQILEVLKNKLTYSEIPRMSKERKCITTVEKRQY